MAQHKNNMIESRIHYKRTIEIAMIISIALLIVAFTLSPKGAKVEKLVVQPPDFFKLKDVERTKWDKLPPPPPKPIIDVNLLPDDIIDDIPIGGSDLNPDVNVPPVNKNLGKDKKENETPVFFEVVEELPEIIGGTEALYEKVQYPELAVKAAIQGLVLVYTYVDKNGNVVKTELKKGIGCGCDEAALRAVDQIQFKPGMQRGKPVNVKILIPIRFVIR